MVGKLLLRGMLVGLVGGFLTFAFAHTFGEPNVDKAIAFEEQMDAAKGEAPEPELVSRPMQSTYGLLTGCLVYGSALGGILALAFAYAYGRVGSIGARETAAWWRWRALFPPSSYRSSSIRLIRHPSVIQRRLVPELRSISG